MRVVGAGFGRTGTSSLKLALERLGFGPCYHMFEIVGERSRAHDWLAAAHGDLPDWNRVFAGYQSTVDWPGAAFWRELLAAYPEAVAILSVRDPGKWHDSVLRTIFRGDERLHTPTAQKIMRLVTIGKPAPRALADMLDAAVRDRVFGGRPADRDHAIGVFERHVAEVTATVPAERLLVFDV